MATYPTNAMLVSDDDGTIQGQNNINFGFPSGSILMWYSSANIPSGWVECNGENGTPNLRGRFPLAAGNSYNPGDQGGQQTVRLNAEHLPPHTHIFPDRSASNCRDGTFSGKSGCWLSGPPVDQTRTSSSVGSGAAHNNMPPYYVLRFIMKR